MNSPDERMCYVNCGLVGEACACYRAMMARNRAAAPVVAVKGLVEAAYIAGAMAVHENYEPCRNPDFSEAATDYASFVVPALNTTPAHPLADPRVMALVDALKGEEDRGYRLSPEARAALSEPAPEHKP